MAAGEAAGRAALPRSPSGRSTGCGGSSAIDTFVELKAVITDFQAKMAVARGEMEKTSKAGSSSFKALSGVAQAGFLAIGAAAVTGAVIAVKAGSELQDSQRRLSVAVADSGGKLRQDATADRRRGQDDGEVRVLEH